MALALILASQVRNIINPETARFTTFEAIEYLNSRKILTFDLQEALRILIQQRILKQAYESIVEGEGKDVSFTKRLLKLARICRVCYFVEDWLVSSTDVFVLEAKIAAFEMEINNSSNQSSFLDLILL